MRWLALLLLVCVRAEGHDFWIEPSTFRPARGAMIEVGLRVGENFVGEPVSRRATRIDSFVVRDAAGERRINGFENRDPAGYMRAVRDGTMVIGYRSKPSRVEMTPEKFARFLREEGFPPMRTSGRHSETFTRFAKAVLGPATDLGFGWRFEIFPESEQRFRVMLDGAPHAGALVTAISRTDPRVQIALRTDRKGCVTLPLPRSGVWLIKSVALIPPKAGSADWETLWASLTFER